ncbi:hypothetical protein GCM10009733_041000 [Nonomuraea maheshkhaliensis]|uniref:DUF4142 domain-containing protein n=1 Tax=Nonomuraea maheshkhaliensis TaxID=419590 RepID=A0ABN2FBR1_9ACTN
MRTRLTLSLAVAALATLPGCAGDTAQNYAAVATPTAAPPSEQDKAWLGAIHQGNLAEVQAGGLARNKGTTKQVKSIGRMLIEDHNQLDRKVTQAATRLGVRLPSSPDAGQHKELNRLEEAMGEDFDQDFLSGMVKAHKQALAATQKEITKGSSPAVVALAKTAAPSLRQHLSALRKAQSD